MRWILVIGGIVALCALVVVIVGARLPTAHVVSVAAEVGASPATVWRTIADPAGYPGWRTDVISVTMLGPGSWREERKEDTISYATEASEPPTRMVVRIADKDLPFGGSWEYRVEPASSGSLVTITERGEVYNPVFRFVSHYFMDDAASATAYLRALASHLGRGAEPRVVPTP